MPNPTPASRPSVSSMPSVTHPWVFTNEPTKPTKFLSTNNPSDPPSILLPPTYISIPNLVVVQPPSNDSPLEVLTNEPTIEPFSSIFTFQSALIFSVTTEEKISPTTDETVSLTVPVQTSTANQNNHEIALICRTTLNEDTNK